MDSQESIEKLEALAVIFKGKFDEINMAIHLNNGQGVCFWIEKEHFVVRGIYPKTKRGIFYYPPSPIKIKVSANKTPEQIHKAIMNRLWDEYNKAWDEMMKIKRRDDRTEELLEDRKNTLLEQGFKESLLSETVVFGLGAVIEINETSLDFKISGCPDSISCKIIAALKGNTKS